MLMDQEQSCLLIVDVQEKLTPHVIEPDALVACCQWMIELANALHIPTMICEQYPKGLGKTVTPILDAAKQHELLEKVYFSGGQEPDIKSKLLDSPYQQFIICGIETHVCVLQTAMDLHQAGKQVFIVTDAVSSRHKQDIKYALKRLLQAGITLVTSEMVFFEWQRHSNSPEFKMLSKTLLQNKE